MKKRVVTWSWEDPEAQRLFSEWVRFPDAGKSAEEVDRIEALLGLRPPARILDVGCGTGRHALELARRRYDVTGIDVAATYLEEARRRAHEQGLAIDFWRQRGAELEKEGAYDIVLAYNHTLGFMSADELVRHLQRLQTALRPGGRMLLVLAGPKLVSGETLETTRDWAEKDGRFVLSEKRIENGYRIEYGSIIDTRNDELIEYHEQQRAFSLEEVRGLLVSAGFARVHCLQDLNGARQHRGRSRSLSVIGRPANITFKDRGQSISVRGGRPATFQV